jgi:uncharacterized membrane protein (UPF0127 family)
MQIKNKTKNTILAEDAAVAESFFLRLKGLLGKEKLGLGQALVIRPGNSIHTFFMRFTIDVLFVDKNSRVVKAISNLKPARLTPVYFAATYVVELPEGAISATATAEGDEIALI